MPYTTCQQNAGVGAFSDEKIICGDGSQGRRYCYVMPNFINILMNSCSIIFRDDREMMADQWMISEKTNRNGSSLELPGSERRPPLARVQLNPIFTPASATTSIGFTIKRESRQERGRQRLPVQPRQLQQLPPQRPQLLQEQQQPKILTFLVASKSIKWHLRKLLFLIQLNL